MSAKKIAHFSPGRIIFFSIFCMILIGAFLLSLPMARTEPISFLDLLFTATSATCVTGLFTIPLDHFTTFGHSIILLLVQIGGLGIITLTIFLMSLFVNMGLSTQVMAAKLLDLDTWHNIKRLIVFIIGLTITLEVIGAFCIFTALYKDYPFDHAIFLSFFHAISSFCNAGIVLFDGGMQTYNHSPIILLTMSALIFCGGFGFVTWHELMRYIKAKRAHKWYALSLNTKIIVYGSILLLMSSTALIYFLEYQHAFAQMNPFIAGINALFTAVSARSAGMLTVGFASLHISTLFLIMIFAFIGAAPASTASGVKLTTFATFAATVKAAIFGRTSVEIKGRSIGNNQVFKAIAIVSLSLLWITISTFLLLITDSQQPFATIFFEAVSAFATLGLSTGITGELSIAGKYIIMASMIAGRIGSLTLILALRELSYRKPETTEFSYPEERILLS
ncbi:MAG TPA: potassium transporter TrkG [Candidatus Babeliales bacterium]|nr:potassium transporter TrkG [Candidatus Babeliales bacterium]